MNVFIEDKLVLTSKEPIENAIYSNDPAKPLLAVVHDHEVLFFDSQMLPFSASYTSAKKIRVAVWAPGDNTLVIGHENGLVAFYDPYLKEAREEAEAHTAAITKIEFSPNQKLMLTQDKNFSVVFWRDTTPIKEHLHGCPLSVVLFVNFQYEKKDKIKKSVRLCFFGDKMGSIFYFEEKRLEVQELCKINGSIKELFFYAKTNSIVVITSTYYLVQFRISTEEDIVPDKKIKISMENSSEHLMGAWIAPTTFVLSSKDSLLKFWNVETGVNYTLNVAKLTDEPADRTRPKVSQFVYDEATCRLVVLLSTNQTLTLAHKRGSPLADETDWSLVESPNTRNLVDVIKMLPGGPSGVSVLCRSGIALFKPFELKIFVDGSRNTKFFIKSPTHLEYFDGAAGESKRIDFAEPIADLFIADQTLTIMNKNRDIFLSTVFELVNNHGKLVPVGMGGSYSFGLKKFTKLSVTLGTSTIHLAKFGYLTIMDNCRLIFVNYKSSVSADYCHPDPDNGFVEIVFNNSRDHFAAIDSAGVVRVFEATATSFRLVHDNLSPREFLAKTPLSLPVDGQKGQKSGRESTENDKNPTVSSSKVKILATVIDETGEKALFLVNQPSENLLLVNLATKSSSAFTLADPKLVEKVCFSKSDSRFLGLAETPEKGKEEQVVSTFVVEGDRLHLFDKLTLQPKTHFLELNFPEVYLASQDSSGEARVEATYPQMFRKLLQTNEGNLALKTFTRNFCFNLVIKSLPKALSELKKIEKSFDLEDFWLSLFEKSLEIRNLKMAELCLSKIKFVRAKMLADNEGQMDLRPTGQGCSDAERLGNLCLAFNKLDQAKRIFLEEKNYFKIAEILFLEQNYDALIRFCGKYDKSLLNYYHMRIAEAHLKVQNYSEFLHICKKAKISRDIIVKALTVERDLEFIQRLTETEGWPEAHQVMAKYHFENGNFGAAKTQLEACGENKTQLMEFTLKHEGNFDKAKAMSLAGARGEEDSNLKMVLGKHKAAVGEVIPALELFVKDQKYLKVIQMLREHDELFQKHEDFRNKILDIVFTRVTQNGPHYAAAAVGNYLLSLEMYEKACMVFMKAGDHVRAQWIASTHNMTHVMRAVERSYTDLGKGSLTHLESEEGTAPPILKMSRQKSIATTDHSLAYLLESRMYEKALGFIADMTSDYQITPDDIASLKSVPTDHKTPLLKLAAKRAAKLGHLDAAIELYSELKDNKKLLKTMIRGKMVPKIIQFANFSREEELLVMAADALQNFPVQFKDVVFNAILNLYVKAKRFGKAVDFLRNFSVELFESGALNDCLECLEKSEKLLPKLKEDEVRNYVEMLKDDRSFLGQFGMAQECLRENNEGEAFNILADLHQNHRSSLYGCCKPVTEQLFVAAVKTHHREAALELAGLVARSPTALRKLLGDSDFQVYLKLSGGAGATETIENDGIEEELD